MKLPEFFGGQADRKIEGGSFGESLQFDASQRAEPQILHAQPVFRLTHVDFKTLEQPDSKIRAAAWVAGGFGVQQIFPVAGQLATHRRTLASIDAGERLMLAAPFIASALLFGLYAVWPNDRRKLMKRIRRHFENSPGSFRHTRGGR